MPGKLLGDPVAAISLSLGLIFGTAGMPHILMRFFTVKDAKEARKSVLYASGFIGYFFNVLLILGLASIVIVSQDLRFFEAGDINGKLLGGGNMVAMHLAHAVGGDLMFGFLAAITFATILAVVSGLALAGASAIARDFYVHVICRGVADEAKELRLTKFATLALGVVAILLGIVFQKVNVAFMVAIAFGVAASANFPVLFLSMFWRGLTTRERWLADTPVWCPPSPWSAPRNPCGSTFWATRTRSFRMNSRRCSRCPWHSPSPSSFRCWIVAKRRHRARTILRSVCAQPDRCGRERSRFALARAVDRLRRRWPEPAAAKAIVSTEAAVFRSRGASACTHL